jgi:hypothetical protein
MIGHEFVIFDPRKKTACKILLRFQNHVNRILDEHRRHNQPLGGEQLAEGDEVWNSPKL